jgi:hypothetical protein
LREKPTAEGLASRKRYSSLLIQYVKPRKLEYIVNTRKTPTKNLKTPMAFGLPCGPRLQEQRQLYHSEAPSVMGWAGQFLPTIFWSRVTHS